MKILYRENYIIKRSLAWGTFKCPFISAAFFNVKVLKTPNKEGGSQIERSLEISPSWKKCFAIPYSTRLLTIQMINCEFPIASLSPWPCCVFVCVCVGGGQGEVWGLMSSRHCLLQLDHRLHLRGSRISFLLHPPIKHELRAQHQGYSLRPRPCPGRGWRIPSSPRPPQGASAP